MGLPPLSSKFPARTAQEVHHNHVPRAAGEFTIETGEIGRQSSEKWLWSHQVTRWSTRQPALTGPSLRRILHAQSTTLEQLR
jgi:hypothetical protein